MGNTMKNMQQMSFMIILYAGNARSASMEAIAFAKRFDFQAARDKIEEAEKAFTSAHKEQTNLLQQEASGEKYEVSIILVHAQDHLMTAMTVKDLANEMIDMYEKIKEMGEHH